MAQGASVATALDSEELRRQGARLIGVMLMLGGALMAWVILPTDRFQEWPFIVFFSLCVTGAVICYCAPRKPRLARVMALFGPWSSFVLALYTINSPAVPFFSVLIVTANAAINPWFGLLAALLSTVPLLLLPLPTELSYPSVGLLWLVAVASWVSSRGLYTVLSWAWNSQQRANALLDQLRHRQEELKRAVAALTEANRRLQRMGYDLAVARLHADELRELKTRFAANLSHELRTPLNLILGFSETMHLTPDIYGDMPWPVNLRRDVYQIYQNSRQLLSLLNDVLDLSRIDGAEMPIHREESDLSAVIAEALDTISNLWRRSDLQLRAELPPLIPALQFDRTRIRQVLINLLTNAARFTAQGAITVSVQVAEREVIVAVTDTGVGIPPDELARIFDEFHQVDRSLRKAQEGAGLGLAICRRFVELHGGRIWAESEVGQGSTLFFALPRTTDAVAARLIRTKALRPQRAGQPTVILVEEDPGVGALLMRYLERYQVLQVPNLGDAATLAREVYPHALVVNLPPGDQAMATAHQTIVEAMPDEIPVVCCSIPSQSWIAGSAQAQGCLTKPFSRQELMRHLQSFPDAQHILIVDDDMGFVQLVERYLDSAATQYTTHWAQDGLQALEQIHITPPDLILLDLMMPRMDGFGFLRALHSEEGLAHIPVLITTASDYTPGLLEQKSSAITLMRRTALQPMETVNYLRAILGLGEAGPLVESAPVPSVAASG